MMHGYSVVDRVSVPGTRVVLSGYVCGTLGYGTFP
ncbi:hypothetical protein A2U01_0046585, partial [Trifolium medium]|nr:hypothetical protein [Trifolium medium]